MSATNKINLVLLPGTPLPLHSECRLWFKAGAALNIIRMKQGV